MLALSSGTAQHGVLTSKRSINIMIIIGETLCQQYRTMTLNKANEIIIGYSKHFTDAIEFFSPFSGEKSFDIFLRNRCDGHMKLMSIHISALPMWDESRTSQ
jgi:hypothetical protein